MAFLGNAVGAAGFDASSVEPQAPITLMPAGEYIAALTASEMKPTQKGGEYLACTFTILEGEYKNRKLWANLNLVNTNDTAVDIARRELSAICHAAGVLRINDSEELHNRPLTLVVKVGKDDRDSSQMVNKIGGYKPMAGNSNTAPARAGAARTGGAGTATATAPVRRTAGAATTQAAKPAQAATQPAAAAVQPAAAAAPREPSWRRHKQAAAGGAA